MVPFSFAGQEWLLAGPRALYWPAERALLVGADRREAITRLPAVMNPAELQAAQQAFTGDSDDEIGLAVLQAFQRLRELVCDLVHVLKEGGLREFVVGRVADSHGERIATDGGAVHAFDHAFRCFLGGEKRRMGPTESKRDTEPLAGSDRHVRTELSR